MKINTKFALVATATLFSATLAVGSAQAALTGYVNNPTTNHEDWTAAVGAVTTNVDFDNADVNATKSWTNGGLAFGFGPGNGNNESPPVSPGEGPSTSSNYLQLSSPLFGGGANNFTVNFTASVAAAGLDIVDYFGASGFNNVFSLSAWTGADGTGTFLGGFGSAQFNFQNNNVYFMGLVSDSANIGSLVLSRLSDDTGDDVGIDNVVSSNSGSTPGVPEPATWGLMLLGFAGMGAMLRRRTASAVTA